MMTKFYIDGIDGEFEGENMGRWNGWACPLFSTNEAMRLMHEVNKGDYGLTITFDDKLKKFNVYDVNADDLEVYRETYTQGRKGYAIGAYAWCWVDVKEGN
jgi:hypothetical protein